MKRRKDDELKVCNCCECGRSIDCWWRDGVRLNAAPERYNGRPICDDCDLYLRRQPSWGVSGPQEDDNDNPWRDFAVRCLEESQ